MEILLEKIFLAPPSKINLRSIEVLEQYQKLIGSVDIIEKYLYTYQIL